MRRGTNQGLTIVEALVALGIFAIAMAALIPVFTSNARTNNRMELRSGAVSAAQFVLDDLRISQRNDWNLTWPTSVTVSAGSHTYVVGINVCATGDTDCLTTIDAKHIRLEVTQGGTTYYEVETVFTRFD